MTDRPSARHAYVQAEVVTALAHQVRALRIQRGWTQRELARRLGTTQAAVSRLEDPSYGKATVQTLLQLARAFDAGLQVRFVSLVHMLQQTFRPQPAADEVEPFEVEAAHVGFAEPASTGPIVIGSDTSQNIIRIEGAGSSGGVFVNTSQRTPWLEPVSIG